MAGYEIDIDGFRKIPFFIFVGSDDTNDPLELCNGLPEGNVLDVAGVTCGEVVSYKNTFGASLAPRTQSYHNRLIALGVDSAYKAYQGVGHDWTQGMKTDTINSFKSIPLNYPVIYVDSGGTCDGNIPCFSTIQDAVNSAGRGTNIKVTGETYNESVVINKPKEIIIQGGWNSTFTIQTSNTTLDSLTINSAEVTLENIVLL